MPIVIEGDGDELFRSLAEKAVDAAGLDWTSISDLGVVLSFVDSGEESLYFFVDENDSIRDLVRLFGSALDSVPPDVQLATGGFGGGDGLIQIWHVADVLLNQGLEVVGIASVMLGLMRAQRAIRYRAAREGVQAWAASGVIPDSLIEQVKAGISWDKKEFKDYFGIDDFRAGELSRASGFEFMTYYANPNEGMWVKSQDPEVSDDNPSSSTPA